MHLDLAKLSHIVAVAELRSFSKAAHRLNITQPALSRSIAATERRFGITIFDRGRGGVSVTRAGAAVIDEAEALLRRARDLEHNLRLQGRGEAGEIRFGMAPMLASVMLPPLSGALLRGGSRLRIQAEIKAPAELVGALRRDELDIAFVPGFSLGDAPDLIVTPLCDLGVAVLVRPGHPLADRDDLVWHDIWNHVVACGSQFEVPPGCAGTFICNNYHLVREIVLASDLVWFSSPRMVEDDLRDGRLRTLSFRDRPALPAETAMIRRRHRSPSPAVAALIDAAMRLFG